jgi:methionyl aminopeptidase
MTCDDIDKMVHDFIISKNAFPSCIGFMQFPKSVCTSVNDVVAHGVPNNKVLEDGDYVNIDITCYYKGHFGDTSAMALIGNVHPDIKRLVYYH